MPSPSKLIEVALGSMQYVLSYITFSWVRAYTFYYMLPLNHLDSLFSSSSINHDLLEDDGWVVRSEGEGVDAIG